jgi:hypothetical protein
MVVMRVEGEVLKLKCSSCEAEFPTFCFSGDTDMVTIGLESVSCLDPAGVVLGTLDQDELRVGVDQGREHFANRMSQLLGTNLVALSVRHWIKEPSGAGMSFQQARRVYRPPQPIYSCPKCFGEAQVASTHEPADFIAQGGRLELTGDLTLA